jgi:hypothetical protein
MRRRIRRVRKGACGRRPVATLAPRPQAYLTDEAGQGLRPPKGHTWAPCGTRPVDKVRGTGGARVSIAGVACFRPGDRLCWNARASESTQVRGPAPLSVVLPGPQGKRNWEHAMSTGCYRSSSSPNTRLCRQRREEQPSLSSRAVVCVAQRLTRDIRRELSCHVRNHPPGEDDGGCAGGEGWYDQGRVGRVQPPMTHG